MQYIIDSVGQGDTVHYCVWVIIMPKTYIVWSRLFKFIKPALTHLVFSLYTVVGLLTENKILEVVDFVKVIKQRRLRHLWRGG